MTTRRDPSGARELLSVRAALILALATLAAIGAGVLSYLHEPSLPAAVLVAGGAWIAATGFFSTLIEH